LSQKQKFKREKVGEGVRRPIQNEVGGQRKGSPAKTKKEGRTGKGVKKVKRGKL